MAQCFELSLHPGINPAEFEGFLWKEVFPHFRVFRRNVRHQEHRLLKRDSTDETSRYLWMVFVSLVGSTPQTAGDGPTELASGLDWLGDIAEAVKQYATVMTYTEVTVGEVARLG